MISPKICSIEEEITKPSSMSQFGEISDSIDVSSTEQQQSNLTIISKLRNKFLLNNKQNPIVESIFIQPSQESTTGNQIFLSTEQ